MTEFIHIERSRLFNDMQYRNDYICAFLGFTDKDKILIKNSAPILDPLIPSIVDALFIKMLSYDAIRAKFLEDMEGFESKTKETMVSLSLDSPPIKFRKEMMQKYLHKVLSATWDFSFLRYIDWVAKIHSDTPEKKTTVKIEYIHIVAFFGYLSGILTDAICRISELDEETKANTITAFNKFLYIQNDLFTKYCINEDYENEQLLETSFESKKKEALGVATQTRREFIPYLVSFAVGGLVLGFVTARVFNSK